MAITSVSSLPTPVQKHFDMKLLAVDDPNLIFSIPSMKRDMPGNSGYDIVFRRYNRLKAATNPLNDTGQSPPPTDIKAVDINAKVQFYGSYVRVTDRVRAQNEDPVLNAMVERLGVQRLESEDELIRDVIAQTGTYVNCVNGALGDNPTELTGTDISDMTRTLLGNNARMFTSGIEGANKFGTAPVRSAFFAMAHTDLTPTLDNLAEFKDKSTYPFQGSTLDSEWGAYRNVRFLISSKGKKTLNASAEGRTVYDIIVTGMESYASIRQSNLTSQFIYRDPLASSELALYSTIGWKMSFACKITNDKWLGRLRCTVGG